MSVIESHGPVPISLGVNTAFRNHRGGILKYSSCPTWYFYGHAVLAVGYDVSASDPSMNYVMLKNSWGGDWGVNGTGIGKIGISLDADDMACGAGKYGAPYIEGPPPILEYFKKSMYMYCGAHAECSTGYCTLAPIPNRPSVNVKNCQPRKAAGSACSEHAACSSQFCSKPPGQAGVCKSVIV